MLKPIYEPNNPAGWDGHLVIAVDYDGTLTSRKDGAVDVVAMSYVKSMRDLGCIIILWTSRYGRLLYEAVEECSKRGLVFDGINENPYRVSSSKISADIYIDDKSTLDGVIDWKGWMRFVEGRVATGAYEMVDRHGTSDDMRFHGGHLASWTRLAMRSFGPSV